MVHSAAFLVLILPAVAAELFADLGSGLCAVRSDDNSGSSSAEVIEETSSTASRASESALFKSVQEEECESMCDLSELCYGFSVDSSDPTAGSSCRLWLEDALVLGSEQWGNARCFVKTG